MSVRIWSGVNAHQLTTASKSRSLIFSRTDSGSLISARIILTWGGRGRVVPRPRLSTNSWMPLPAASREQAELITPVPPMKRTLRSPIPPSCRMAVLPASARVSGHLRLGPDDVDDGVDEGQVGEGLREVAEVAAAGRIYLLRVQVERACQRQ